jgi:hypothetical protein
MEPNPIPSTAGRGSARENFSRHRSSFAHNPMRENFISLQRKKVFIHYFFSKTYKEQITGTSKQKQKGTTKKGRVTPPLFSREASL